MIFDFLRDSLLPQRCVFCGVRCLSCETFLCIGCLNDLPWQQNPLAEPMPPLTALVAPLQYEFPVDAAIKRLKFHRRLDYAPGLGELLCRMQDELPGDIDAVLPMPLHWRRHAIRGFNQADELARALRRKAAWPIQQGIRRIRSTPYQSGLKAAARKRNLQGAFAATKPVTARHVLIVDDVVTTGESCRQLARTLLQAGASKVSALALARV